MSQSLNTLRAALACAAVFPILACASADAAKPAGAQQIPASSLITPYLKAHSFQAVVDSTTAMVSAQGGAATTMSVRMTVTCEKPNLLRMDMDILGETQEIISNGKREYIYSGMTNSYSVMPAPASPLIMMTAQLGAAQSLRLIGQRSINAQLCNVYAGSDSTPMGDGVMRVAVSCANGLVQRLFFSVPTIQTPRGARYKISVTETFSDQRLNLPISRSFFQFQPPAGATKTAASRMPSLLGIPGAPTQ